MMLFLQLFFNFFLIGLFTIGGGYAMLPLIRHQVVISHRWISDTMFTDIVAISQMTPGPIGINSATYIGYSVINQAGYNEFLCVCGSFTATLAVVLPSFLIVLALCRVYSRFNHSPIFTGTMKWLKPCVAGLIGSAALILVNAENFIDWKSWAICAGTFVTAMFTRLSPILILVASAAAGLVLYA